MKEAEERKKERLRIAKMPSIQLISTFEQLVRNGAGVANIPLIWYRDEILDRCVKVGLVDEDKRKLIEDLENIKNKDSIVIDDLEMSLLQLRKDHEMLIDLLMSLKSKVKNDEEIK